MTAARIALLLGALVAGCAGSGPAAEDPRVQACKDNFPPYDPARQSCLAAIEAEDDEAAAEPQPPQEPQ